MTRDGRQSTMGDEMTETEMRDRVAALSDEASSAGDLAMVAICERALAGDSEALAECERVMAAAAAMLD